MTEIDQDVELAVVAWWRRTWPPAALAIMLIVEVAWIGLLGYGLVKLL